VTSRADNQGGFERATGARGAIALRSRTFVSRISRAAALHRLASDGRWRWMVDAAPASLSAGFLLALYGRTLLRTVGGGDTANFQFIGRILGITHAPGYPLYAMATGLLTSWVPRERLALAVNLLSALFSVAASDLLRRFLVRSGVARPVALGLALVMGVEPIVWRSSIAAEVYTLHLLLSCATFLGFQRWTMTRTDGALIAACSVYALSFGNHLNTVTLLPAVALLVWEVDRRMFLRPRLIATVAGVVLIGAAQYLYLIVRSRVPAPYCEVTARTVDSFLWVVTGGGFKDLMFRFSIRDLVTIRLPLFASIGFESLGVLFVPGLALVLLRARTAMDRFNRRAFVWATFWPLNYAIDDIDNYFMVSFACVCIALGGGVADLEGWVSARWPAAARVVSPVAAALALLVAGHQVVNRFDAIDRSRERRAEVVAANIIANLGDGALVLSRSYESSETLWYYALGQRLQRSRRMYVVHHVDAAQVLGYLRDGIVFNLPEEPGLRFPPHLRVISLGPENNQAVAPAGLTARLLTHDPDPPSGNDVYEISYGGVIR
jgi:hypothetical protein